uniref:Arginine decarboxylase n=1 Tax=Rhizophora mucronata TaxID=61149 RepID=A0A2P2QU18_RHIMU
MSSGLCSTSLSSCSRLSSTVLKKFVLVMIAVTATAE